MFPPKLRQIFCSVQFNYSINITAFINLNILTVVEPQPRPFCGKFSVLKLLNLFCEFENRQVLNPF